MTVANKIKAFRLQKAWSQEQLAQVASLSVRTVQRTEKGQKPSLETLGALASAFGVNVSELSEDDFVAGDALDARISQAHYLFPRQISLAEYWLFRVSFALRTPLSHPG